MILAWASPSHVFLNFDLGIDLTALKNTLNPQNNTINGFSIQNPMKKQGRSHGILITSVCRGGVV